jgi:glutaredoxin 3
MLATLCARAARGPLGRRLLSAAADAGGARAPPAGAGGSGGAGGGAGGEGGGAGQLQPVLDEQGRPDMVEALRRRVDRNKGVLVLTKTNCPYCDLLEELLRKARVSAEVHNMDTHALSGRFQQAVMAVTGQRTVPCIFVGKELVGGYREFSKGVLDGRIIRMLDELEVPHLFDDRKT